jgi:filamentous hemagglutinin
MNAFTTPKGRIISRHAAISLVRHGFTEPFNLVDEIIDSPSYVVTQADGSTVYIQSLKSRGNRYNLIIVGEEGIVTGLRQLSRQDLNNLARNYGWEPW